MYGQYKHWAAGLIAGLGVTLRYLKALIHEGAASYIRWPVMIAKACRPCIRLNGKPALHWYLRSMKKRKHLKVMHVPEESLLAEIVGEAHCLMSSCAQCTCV